MTGDDDAALKAVHEKLVTSWRRSKGAGVNPTITTGLELAERPASTLLRAARPVMAQLAQRLSGTMTGIWLADERGAIVDRELCDKSLSAPTDRIGAIPGFGFGEEVVGTNGVGTPIEESRPVCVVGGEHFAEAFNDLACAGAPVRHPVTRRILGVIDVTCPAKEANTLLLPVALDAAEAIESRLLEDASAMERLLLEHYLRATKSSRHGVVSLSTDTLITNGKAARLLAGVDHVFLWEQVARALRDGGSSTTLHLSGAEGRTLVAECRELNVEGETFGGLLFVRAAPTAEVAPRRRALRAPGLHGLVGSSSHWRAVEEAAQASSDEAVIVTGERGAGKMAVALAMAERRSMTPTVIDTADAEALGAGVWLANVAATLDELPDDAAVVIARLDRLEPETMETLVTLLDRAEVTSLATAVRHEAGRSEPGFLDPTGFFTGRVHVPALRHRPEDLAALVRHFDTRHGLGRLVWSSEVLQLMQRYFWPGNVKELEQTVKGLLGRLSPTSEVTPAELPEELRRNVVRKALSRLEQAEVDVILAAMAEAKGNKDLAAQLIGMHRATLYRKIQSYGLDLSSNLF